MDTTATAAPPSSSAGSSATPPPLTAHLSSAPHAGEHFAPPKGLHLGREKVSWDPKVWERIDRAVQREFKRTRVAAKFLPHHRVDPHITTVPADTVLANLNTSTPYVNPQNGEIAAQPTTPPLLNIDEGATTRLIEIWVEFSLTPAQVQEENHQLAAHPEPHPDPKAHPDAHGHHEHHRSSTACTLATRAANILSLAQDTVIFQGANAFPVASVAGSGTPLFQSETVLNRGVPSDTGLLCIGGPTPLPQDQILIVAPVTPTVPPAAGASVLAQYSENTVAQIHKAYALLSANGYPGPYVCVLHYYPWADSFAPLANTLILPADRIKPIMEEGYHASVALPGVPAPQNPQVAAQMPNPPIIPTADLYPASGVIPAETQPQAMGLVISLGGNTVDLVNGLDPVTAFSQLDPTGNYLFRVLTRFALRLKDPGAVIRLEFQ